MSSNLRVSRIFISFIFLVLLSFAFGFFKLNAIENNSSNFYQNLVNNNTVLIKKMDLNLDSIKDVIVITESNNDSIDFRVIYLFLGDSLNNYTLIDSNSKIIFKEFGATRNQLDEIQIENNDSKLSIIQCIGWSYNWHSYLILCFEINAIFDYKLLSIVLFEAKLKNNEDVNSEWVEIIKELPNEKLQGLNFHNLNSNLIIEQISNK